MARNCQNLKRFGKVLAMSNSGSKPRWLNEDEMNLWRLMLAANRHLDRAMDDSLQAHDGMSTPEYAVLVALSDADTHQLRLRDLCEELEWDRSRTSHQITRMVKRGLVKKVRCVGDARGVLVEITPEGEEKLRRAVPAHVETVREVVFDHLNYDDIPQITKFFEGILNTKRTGEK